MPAMKVKSAHGKAKKGTLGRLLKMLFKDFKWQMIVCMICIILTSISNFTSSIFVKNITEVITRGVRDVSYNPNNDRLEEVNENINNIINYYGKYLFGGINWLIYL